MFDIVRSIQGTLRVIHTQSIQGNNQQHISFHVPPSMPDFLKPNNHPLFFQKNLHGLTGTLIPCMEACLTTPNLLSSKIIYLPEVVYLHTTCSSSLDIAYALHKENLLPVWGSIIVTSQTAGRGQLGRAWRSPPGNLYATIRLPQCSLFSNTKAAIVASTFFIHALNNLGFHVFLKWPNDIVISINKQWGKVGGILLEERNDILLAGLGINIQNIPNEKYFYKQSSLPPAQLPTSPHFSIHDCILLLWSSLVRQAYLCYTEYSNVIKQKSWIRLAERYLCLKNHQVVIKDGLNEQQCVEGTILGIHDNGGLILSTSKQKKIFLSGSLYPLP